ncbi:UDP-4-amino-4,6-dideoxy-N-acetyl-beta-L-altrosamine transaminase [Flavobacteriaceae bacterium]|nr:UDP-4-amino-4,6-dideoxy-N-acetyl-beta-L-altrosamine transaminase [Flavobacteriaceae bacterium]
MKNKINYKIPEGKLKGKIPYGYHHVDQDDINSVVNSLNKYSITQGNLAIEFGQKTADFTGAKHGLAVSSATAGLHLAVCALDLKKGDEVITCPMSFCATSNAVLYQGGKVVFVDIDMETLNIDINQIEEKINDNTKAIIPIDFRGHPANLYEIKLLAKKYNLTVIEDASHSIGSSYEINGSNFNCGDGNHADMCIFSFHPVKHITTGEGGMILTNDSELFKKLTLLHKHGIDRRDEMFSEELRRGAWFYEMENLGYNYRMNEMQAALGISQLNKIDFFIKRRREIVKIYNSELSKIKNIIIPPEDKNVNSNFHIYVIQILENNFFDRYDLFNHLLESDYAPMVHYIPIHLLKYYKKTFNYKPGDFPNCEKYYNRCISLPLFPSISDDEIYRVIKTIKDFVNNKLS